jgi:type IV pilus assembly protein PilV
MRADMMTLTALPRAARQAGTTLIEVLVTVVLMAFGLLGIAAFQAKAQVGALEAYQRAQAVVLLEDLQARISGNPENAGAYVSAATLGTGAAAVDCTGVAAGSARDLCEWGAMLRGAAESQGSAGVGAMIGARGCVEQIQARVTTDGLCKPGIYRATVAWQGMHATAAPVLTCGKDSYGANDALRRAISVRVAVGTPNCKPA